MTTVNKIHLKPKAYEDLESIYNYSLLNFGETKAVEYINNFDKAFTSLSKGESIGKNCDYINLNLLKFNVNSHVIFYKYEYNSLEVLRILHQKQDYSRHL